VGGTLNYSHVPFASNDVRVYNTAADFARDMTDYRKRWRPGTIADGNRCKSSKVVRHWACRLGRGLLRGDHEEGSYF